MTKNYNDELAGLSRGIARQNKIDAYVDDLATQIAHLSLIAMIAIVDAMYQVQLPYGHVKYGDWITDRKINMVIDNGVALGWLWRGSRTQVQWTDKGMNIRNLLSEE